MHPDRPRWRAYLDSEMEADEIADLERHLKDCGVCGLVAAELQSDKVSVAEMLGSLEGPASVTTVEDILQSARRPASGRWALIAAMILLGFVTVAGATIATGAFQTIVERIRRPPSADTLEKSPVPDQSPALTGIALETAGTAEIIFLSSQVNGTLTITEGDRSNVDIVATATVPYTVRSGRVTIVNAGTSADYRIIFPRGLHRALVRVADRVLFSRDGSVVRAAVKPDSTGQYVVSLSSSFN
ncbi:MAG: zf-HC2 domain-containing protein [Gemmatimonadota bacterium]